MLRDECPRITVCSIYRFQCQRPGRWQHVHGMRDQFGDGGEADPSLEEELDRSFVGGIQDRRCRSAFAHRAEGKGQTGKALHVRILEREPSERGKIHPLETRTVDVRDT